MINRANNADRVSGNVAVGTQKRDVEAMVSPSGIRVAFRSAKRLFIVRISFVTGSFRIRLGGGLPASSTATLTALATFAFHLTCAKSPESLRAGKLCDVQTIVANGIIYFGVVSNLGGGTTVYRVGIESGL